MGKRAIVVTVGSPKESLGAMKLASYLRRIGYEVEERTSIDWFDSGRDLYCFSVVFSWKLPKMVDMARLAVQWGEVWIGGPAVSFSTDNAKYVERETGIAPSIGIDERFEREIGDFPMVYFSRGCPAFTPACGMCPVPRLEGTFFRYYRDAKPAKFLLDNNLSELPADYQDHIIERYAAEWTGGKVDANSGFEPHSFTESTLLRWQKFPLMFWRFGYDDITERDEALEMMRLLKRHGYQGEKVRVYTMIGNESVATCHQRVREVIEMGMHPWPQRLRPLNWLGPDGTLPTRHDWDEPTLIAFQRFFSYAGMWKKHKPEEFFYQQRYPLAMLATEQPRQSVLGGGDLKRKKGEMTMNTSTGEVRDLSEVEKEFVQKLNRPATDTVVVKAIKREWVEFTPGEIIEVRGIKFSVHDVSDQRLVLKFQK